MAFFEGILLFVLLNFFYKKFINIKPGIISALFLIFYSFLRFLIEFTREPDSHIGFFLLNLSLGQLICIIFLIIGIVLFYRLHEVKK